MMTPHNAPEGFDWITALERWNLENDTLQLEVKSAGGRSARIMIQAITPKIWKCVFIPPGESEPFPSPIVNQLLPHLPIATAKTATGLQVSGAELALELDTAQWCMRFIDQHGFDVCRENPTDIDGLGRSFILPLGFIASGDKVVSVTESFHLRQDEHLFGLGEKFTPLDKRQQRIVTWTQDAFGSTSERSHKNIPFLISTRGYGLFVNTGAKIVWDLGMNSSQTYSFTVEHSSLEMYIIYGPTPAEILKLYTLLTGTAPVPPKWTFGLWISSGGTYRNRTAMERLIKGLAKNNIAADVVHIDPWWMKWRTYCDFHWDKEAFPDTEEFIAWVHSLGLKVCLWEHPYISIESDLFSFGKENGFFVRQHDGEPYIIDYGLSLAPCPDGVVRTASAKNSWNARVTIVDLTNNDAYNWYKDLHRPLFKMGIDVFKTDFGEDVPIDAVFSNGETGQTMHNLYPLLYNRAVSEVTNEERGYGIVWSRSGTAGSQRYPICWSGDPAADYDSLACTIRGGLSAGISGLPFWSNDIGGYRGMPTPDLYIRWAQFGLFCSHSRMHGDSPREPWRFGRDVLGIVRAYIDLRYRLFPYIYSTAHESHLTGMPVMRAMPLAFPDDRNTYDKDLQYMLGPWLLVAPVYDKSEQRSVYFPDGRWVCWKTGKEYDGPQNSIVSAPLDMLPLFVRAGAIIPMMTPLKRIPEGLVDPLIVEIFSLGQSNYTLYEGETITAFSCDATKERIVFSWQGLTRRMLQLKFHCRKKPKRSTITHGKDDQHVDDAEKQFKKKIYSVLFRAEAEGEIKIHFTQ